MLKRLFLTVLLIALHLVPLYSQVGEWMFETRLGFPVFDRTGIVYPAATPLTNSEITFQDKEHSSYSLSTNDGSYKVQYNNSPVILPAIYLSSGYRFNDVPLSVHLDVTLSYAFNNLYGGPGVLKENEAVLHIMPEMRAYYMRKRTIKMYGSVAIGLRARYYSETLEGDTVTSSDYRFTWQLSPFGMEVGKSWYFCFSLGYSRAWAPIILGVGYRFPQF